MLTVLTCGAKIPDVFLLFLFLLQRFRLANLDPEDNHWQNVYDFNDEQRTGKNWSIIGKRLLRESPLGV